MYKRTTILLALLMLVGLTPLAQATVIVDFEAPAWTQLVKLTEGANAPNGWADSSNNGFVVPRWQGFVDAGQAVGLASGELRAGPSTEYIYTEPLAGNFLSSTPLNMLLGYEDATGGWYHELFFQADNGSGVVDFIHLGMDNGNGIYAFDGAAFNPLGQDANGRRAWDMTLNIDFAAQTYDVTFTDLLGSDTVTSPSYGFSNPITLAQANASGEMRMPVLRSTGTERYIYLDNQTIVPEPSALALLVAGLISPLCYARRKRK